MKYYAACSQDIQVEAASIIRPQRMLLSFFYFDDPAYIQTLLKKGFEIFIDSGAFSYRNSGKSVDLDKYCKFLIESGVTTYAGLDVIGDAKTTMENQKRMEQDYGLKPIPTFHMGSTLEDLHEVAQYDYIALGGLVHSPGIEQHLDEAWHYLLERNPNIRVHGFGVTNLKIVEKYPWYSVDSSSWQSCPRFGRIALLRGGKNFETISEDEFVAELQDKYKYPKEVLEVNATRWHLEYLYAVRDIKTYIDIVTEEHKYKDFSNLSHQKRLL